MVGHYVSGLLNDHELKSSMLLSPKHDPAYVNDLGKVCRMILITGIWQARWALDACFVLFWMTTNFVALTFVCFSGI